MMHGSVPASAGDPPTAANRAADGWEYDPMQVTVGRVSQAGQVGMEGWIWRVRWCQE